MTSSARLDGGSSKDAPIPELLGGGGLHDELKRCGLDWKSEIGRRLAHYILGNTGIAEIDSWLKQFDRLGNFRSVGILADASAGQRTGLEGHPP